MTRSIADGGWEITTRSVGFSDHRAAGLPTQVLLGVEKQRKACPDPRVLTGSTHRSPAKERNGAPDPAKGETTHGTAMSGINASQALFDAHSPVRGYF
ncbi:hypothetical protein NDU88_001910 [Pleurodeles waltl]|uniref:Uncharacterized protein n=1 Tax=Pleurodeles waltl TaxID=8319 RepID=A0AAV7MN22_PLEWA|nr:hypothetical protein NDU88_001910 [Pleurodeles waltl]